MSKNHKITYAVNEEKTSLIVIKESDLVSDVLHKIQTKEGDKEYTHLFYDGAEIDADENFFVYYDPQTVYVASKTPEVPDSLTNTVKGMKITADDDEPSIDEDDAMDFEMPEPEDEEPDDDDFETPEPPTEMPEVKGKGKKGKKGFEAPEPPTITPDTKKDKKGKKGFEAPEPPTITPDTKKKSKNRKAQNFIVHTSLTLNSMLKGDIVEGIDKKMDVGKVKNVILKWIKKEESFEDILEDKSNLQVHLYLPGGAPFLSGTFEEWEHCLDTPVVKTLYAVVTRKLGDLADDICEHVCDCSSDEMQLLLSPLNDSTPEGYTQIASLLGYFYYGGSLPSSENLLRNLATMTGFVPMINSIYTIMVQKKVSGMMVASITAPLQTFIREKIIGIDANTAFSYTISLMSYVNSTKIKNLPVPNLITYSIKKDDDDDGEEPNSTQVYLKEHNLPNFVVLWDKDFELDDGDTFKVTKQPAPVKVKQLNECLKSEMSLKPVSPMTILYLHSVSFIRTQKANANSTTKVGLFIRKKPQVGNLRNIVFINPEEGGEQEEIDYEDLADHIKDRSIDENIKSRGDTSLQQIIFICLDTSLSMRNLLNGRVKKLRSKEPSRKELSIRFLKSLMRRIHDFKIPTERGLILFGEKIEVACSLSVKEKDFDEAVKEIKPYGTTPLWNAVDMAADEIIKFNPSKVVDGEKRYKYPEAKGRIILISDADDTEAESDDKYSIAEKLVKNNIVMDVIMISTAEECRDALITAKITGGLSFKPENEEQGIEIFENEAFLDINARSDFMPNEKHITENVFREINKDIGKNPYANPNEIKNKFIKQATIKAELSSVAYTLFYRNDERFQPKSICERYIIKQLNRIRKRSDPNIAVYVFQQELKKWRVFIKGPDGTPYANAWWHIFVSFPSNYPNSPPQFRFISVPYHQNVSPEGLLLFTQIADGYEPQGKITSLLKNIRNLFKKPDDLYCLRGSILDERNKDNAAFTMKAQASKTAYAKDDYHEYLEGLKVNEEIPEGGIIDDGDDEGPGDLIYMTIHDHDGNRKRKIISDSDDEIEVDE